MTCAPTTWLLMVWLVVVLLPLAAEAAMAQRQYNRHEHSKGLEDRVSGQAYVLRAAGGMML
jgi:hypothetical protein